MDQKSGTSKDLADKLVRGIKRKTRKHDSAGEKTRIALAGLRGEDSISAPCRRKGIARSLQCSRSKGFLEAGTAPLSGDTAGQATTPEVTELRSASAALKEVVAEPTLENRVFKKHDRGRAMSRIGPRTMSRAFEDRDTRPPRRSRSSARSRRHISPWSEFSGEHGSSCNGGSGSVSV